MPGLISVSDAAHALGLDPSRVRRLAADGALPALRIGGRWVIDGAGVDERKNESHPAGRPLAAHNSWALLFIASSWKVDWVTSQARSRLRRSLWQDGLAGLQPRLRERAEVKRYRAHAGEIPHVLDDPVLVASGISAARDLRVDLLSASEADGYIKEAASERFVARHALERVGPGDEANVKLRVVPDSAWHLDDAVAPPAAVALDLSEDPDARSRKAGAALLRELDGLWQKRS